MLPRINELMEKSKEMIFRLLYLSSEELPVGIGTKRYGDISSQEKRENLLG
mgnify:CR=1 FL=1